MTFSIVGRCARTGMLGVAITTSSICVGARCPHVRAGVGAVSSQNVTDPALGLTLLDALEEGLDAEAALRKTIDGKPHLDYRQLTVVDREGRTACFSGQKSLGVFSEAAGLDCFAAGNLLSKEQVPIAMVKAFEDGGSLHLAARLLFALYAGLSVGGEAGPVHSAALKVADKQPFPLADLRVDWAESDPVDELNQIWEAYQPQMMDYVARAVDPSVAPSYGVPGDD